TILSFYITSATTEIYALSLHDALPIYGGADLLHLELLLNTDGLATEDDDYSTMAGFMLERFGKLPEVGARCEHNDGNAVFTFTVERMEGRRIATVLIERHPAANSETEETR